LCKFSTPAKKVYHGKSRKDLLHTQKTAAKLKLSTEKLGKKGYLGTLKKLSYYSIWQKVSFVIFSNLFFKIPKVRYTSIILIAGETEKVTFLSKNILTLGRTI
jgi:hypothetical protein